MKLRHLHLPGLTPYLRASAIQEYLVRQQLNRKVASPPLPALHPILLTFQTPPTYTTGRRESPHTSLDQIAYLCANGKAEHQPALRGGATTFHGPGQVTAYLVLDLGAHGLGVKSYVRMLEDSARGTCAHYGLDTFTTQHPGLWIGRRPKERKLVSLGVHVRRHITSHGLGVNVNVDLWWFDRIVMCGLEGKKATNIERELETLRISGLVEKPDPNALRALGAHQMNAEPTELTERLHDIKGPRSVTKVADVLAENLAERLFGVDGAVENVKKEDVCPELLANGVESAKEIWKRVLRP